MTADRDPIQQYLDQLRLSLRIPEVGRILVEAEDHLREAAAAGMAAGLTEREAQEAAISAFGSVRAIVYAHQTRHGRVAAVLADLGIALWRVFAFYLLAFFALGLVELMEPGAADCPAHSRSCALTTVVPEASPLAMVISWAAMGAVGVALFAAYFLVRRFQRRRGRVWSVPLGGYFPLTATLVSIAVGTGLLMLWTGAGVRVPGAAVIIFGALGLAVTYGARMWRMLRNQSRGWNELA
jgi:hypothetical protein